MKKKLSIASIIGASVLAIWGAGSEHYIPALVLTAYMAFWLYAQTVTRIKKKPRAATRGKGNMSSQHRSLYCDDSTVSIKTQIKAWSPAGKAMTRIYYSE